MSSWEQGSLISFNSFIFRLRKSRPSYFICHCGLTIHISLWIVRGFQKGSVNVTSPSLFRTDHNFYGFQQMSWFLELSFRVMGLLRHLCQRAGRYVSFFFIFQVVEHILTFNFLPELLLQFLHVSFLSTEVCHLTLYTMWIVSLKISQLQT